MSRAKRLSLIIALSVLSTLTLTTSAAAVTAFAYQNRVQPRTIIAGQSIGNLSRTEAEQIIISKQEQLAATSLDLLYSDQHQVISLNDLGVSIAGPETGTLPASNNPWEWVDPSYWLDFFSQKEVTLRYQIDNTVAQKKIEATFGITNTAENARIAVTNGNLEVLPSRTGESLSLAGVVEEVRHRLKTGVNRPVTLAVTTVEPAVSTALAEQTKTEIEQTLQPIYLTGEGKNFLIPKSHLYDLTDYEPKTETLAWRINDDRLQNYLASKIAGKVNVKMVQKQIQSDTQEVTQEGKDGKSVDIGTLVSAVRRTITERASTKEAPIALAVKTIPFTEQTIAPEYVSGLFEGLYVDINISKQKLFIMNGQTKTAQYLISSGKRGTPTPIGLFYIKNKIELAQSRLYPGIWMRKWNALARNADGSGYDGFGIHDLPAFNKEYTLIEGESHLGRPVSHGCVRLGHDAAVWFYDNIPPGTPVNIHT